MNAVDKTNFLTIESGVYYPTIGKSNQEIAALSRSCHQSQGFGSTGSRGEDTEYLELIEGQKLQNKTSIFEGIDTTWNRVANGKPIGELLNKIIAHYDFTHPEASLPDLLKAYSMIEALNENHWKPIKLEEIKKCIAACSGLFLEAVAQNQDATPGSLIKLKLEAINRSALPMQLTSLTSLPDGKISNQKLDLKNNVSNTISLDLHLPETIGYTQPYWLNEKGTEGMYTVLDQTKIGIPDIIREAKVVFTVLINGVAIPFERTVVYKYNDGVKGEVYNYLDIVPAVTTAILDKVSLFTTNKSKYLGVKITAGKDNVKGNLKLEFPSNWKVSPEFLPFSFSKEGMEQILYFEVFPPNTPDEVMAKSIAIVDNVPYDKEQTIIDLNHITKQQVLETAESKCIRMDLKISDKNIAYIMGAGDEVPDSLIQMGYKVSLLDPDEITPEKLAEFDVVMTGVRAYNTVEALANKQKILFDFVKNGKTMLVQYNTPNDLVTDQIAPFPLKISKDRVTDENAEVQFLAPNNPVLNTPNTISEKDFEGWKQEQGVYYPNDFDQAFIPILSSNDKGETPKKGALLIAPYGKGYYIYTGLSLFRELPEGVSGAYKLVSNMISLQNPVTIPPSNLKP
jgi:hypothetical protein